MKKDVALGVMDVGAVPPVNNLETVLLRAEGIGEHLSPQDSLALGVMWIVDEVVEHHPD